LTRTPGKTSRSAGLGAGVAVGVGSLGVAAGFVAGAGTGLVASVGWRRVPSDSSSEPPLDAGEPEVFGFLAGSPGASRAAGDVARVACSFDWQPPINIEAIAAVATSSPAGREGVFRFDSALFVRLHALIVGPLDHPTT